MLQSYFPITFSSKSDSLVVLEVLWVLEPAAALLSAWRQKTLDGSVSDWRGGWGAACWAPSAGCWQGSPFLPGAWGLEGFVVQIQWVAS